MKKLLCVLLTVVLLLGLCLSLAACGEENNQGEMEDNALAFSMGKTVGTTYTNTFLGISCTLPEGWVFASEKEILEQNQLVGEYLDEDTLAKLEQATIIYDMSAQDPADFSNVNVNMEKLTTAQITSINVKQVLEQQIPALVSAYENIGYTNVDVVSEIVTVDGRNFNAIRLSADIYGVEFHMVCFSFKKSTYLANVAVGAISTEKVEEILSCFTIK